MAVNTSPEEQTAALQASALTDTMQTLAASTVTALERKTFLVASFLLSTRRFCWFMAVRVGFEFLSLCLRHGFGDHGENLAVLAVSDLVAGDGE